VEGDANTTYFHSCANGRRKTRICALEGEEGTISGQNELKAYVVDFYKRLFGSSRHSGVHMSSTFWSSEDQLNEMDRNRLEEPFSEKDMVGAIEGMKSDSAPVSNGFTVAFFKKLCHHIKYEIMKIVGDFNDAKLDLQRLNYGVITLVPKVREANTIKQYKSICLLNVDFKIFSKLLIDRLIPMADKLINPNQTTFIKGRNILEGVVILHEVTHEFRKTGK
jgi:hypothetical protein